MAAKAAATLRAVSSLRLHLRPLTWFATAALMAFVLLQSMALAHGVMRGAAAGWTEVCTADGMRMVSLDTGEQAPADPGGHLGHCPLCNLAADGSVAVPPAQPVWQLDAPVQAAPAAFLHAPRTLFAWASAQPRAPPSLLA